MMTKDAAMELLDTGTVSVAALRGMVAASIDADAEGMSTARPNTPLKDACKGYARHLSEYDDRQIIQRGKNSVGTFLPPASDYIIAMRILQDCNES